MTEPATLAVEEAMDRFERSLAKLVAAASARRAKMQADGLSGDGRSSGMTGRSRVARGGRAG